MGNCLHHGSSSASSSSSPMQWGGDDWGSTLISDHDHGYYHKGMKMEEHEEAEEGCLLGDVSDCDNNVNTGGGGDFRVSSSTKTTTTTEVKIKITKKQLEELLGRAELKQLSVQQVLAQLMNVSDRYETNQRSWRPALQSIPEVN
ncbi:hypothetical protein Dsin_023092 [Dipteronia sinensis]|uniref:Uncharacterized protein n=1 Tax=Dipteronia sinensis TaxID=43782 RepID=A0AAE0E1R9_9ROSI|nr:hypothetical protein Dsin_023092 [Dipteronia sinensis]